MSGIRPFCAASRCAASNSFNSLRLLLRSVGYRSVRCLRLLTRRGGRCSRRYGLGFYGSQICPAGTFSGEGQASCTPCSSGTYCPHPGSTQDGQPCPVGHFCGAQTSIPQPCRPGTLQDQTGEASCKLCPRGHYCSNYRASAPTGECYGGTMCVEGATHPSIMDQVYSFEAEQNGLCPPGHFCSAGAVQPMPCPAGQYQVEC